MEEYRAQTTRIVFGTGICMQNNWRLILKYFTPQYFSDNSAEKWHTHPMGDAIECIPPEKIKELNEPQVLIAIGDPYAVADIKKQLADIGVTGEAITDFLEIWGEKEELPKRLSPLMKETEEKRILLFNSPEHDNIGDHMISVAELKFIQKYFPEYQCIEITDIEYLWFHRNIRKWVKKEDIILITGGGFLGSLWLYNGELNVRGMIEEYPENKIVILPQTIFFEDNFRGEEELSKTVEIYSRHENLIICLREKNSYELMKRFLESQENILLIPDMALSLDYSRTTVDRKDVLICLRSDKECVLKDNLKNEIVDSLKKLQLEYSFTLMHTGNCFQIETREIEIAAKAQQMRSAELVVTDTLHGMILCAITGTPCLVFDNLSHKVSGVYKWIEEIPYVHLHKQGESLVKCIRELLSVGAGQYNTNFLKSYYEDLAKVIGE